MRASAVLLVRLGVQEDREVATDRGEPRVEHVRFRGADDDAVPVAHGQPEQGVAHGAADEVGVHGPRCYTRSR